MLVRSASIPYKNFHNRSNIYHLITKPQSLSLTSSSNSAPHIALSRACSDFRNLTASQKNPFNHTQLVEDEEDGGGNGSNRHHQLSTGGGDDNDTTTDVYYEKMIKSDPGNALLLGNYAKFLKEVRGDGVKAEEYCERAILMNPSDGKIAALYANLIWDVHRDESRADNYFQHAVQAEPNDCYVMASYARFLWEVEDDDEEDSQSWKSFSTTTPDTDTVHQVASPSIAAY